ncbi:MAG: crotonase/enoyl-CoA hydratase family protein [Phenylobacterium sp.]|uniref:crotonase/enoyl-CoA hydratase family protein n=1 Tax=Phenylobacterium sp. TaxID=1871053 RepID=UPI0027350EA2|nr:crotonase/enoyl-CoA hydratase family protein [Phenylobacterium sp.]MDP3173305.1 crotonase/enoyl-CoA hydratase family protein [Phenylobacterium sp.]
MSQPQSSQPVLVDRDGHVMIVTINRPEARNAVNLGVHMGVGLALEEADKDPGVWAVIITGAGDQAFCAGADLKAISRGEKLGPDDPAQAAWGFAGYATHHISKPTIAAVNGFALGGGTELTLASDLAVAADTASFGLPEVKRGIIAGAGGAFRLTSQLPPKIAMELLLTGDRISAARALELGLVNAVAPQKQVLETALALAARITANAPLAVQASKRIARGAINGHVEHETSGWAQTYAEMPGVMASADGREGVLAFAEKRNPVWSAR